MAEGHAGGSQLSAGIRRNVLLQSRHVFPLNRNGLEDWAQHIFSPVVVVHATDAAKQSLLAQNSISGPDLFQPFAAAWGAKHLRQLIEAVCADERADGSLGFSSEEFAAHGAPRAVPFRWLDKSRPISHSPVRFVSPEQCEPPSTLAADRSLLDAASTCAPSVQFLKIALGGSALDAAGPLLHQGEASDEGRPLGSQNSRSAPQLDTGAEEEAKEESPRDSIRITDTYRNAHGRRAVKDLAPDFCRFSDVPAVWWENWTEVFYRSLEWMDHESFCQPIGVVLVVSSSDLDPVKSFEQLSLLSSMPAAMRRDTMEGKPARSYVYLHDCSPREAVARGAPQPPPLMEAKNAFDLICDAFPSGQCHLLEINRSNTAHRQPIPEVQALFARHLSHRFKSTREDAAAATSPPYPLRRAQGTGEGEIITFPDEFPSDFCRALDMKDANRIQEIVHKILIQTILPSVEKKMRQADLIVSQQRKGIRNHLRKFLGGGSRQKGASASSSATASSDASKIAESALEHAGGAAEAIWGALSGLTGEDEGDAGPGRERVPASQVVYQNQSVEFQQRMLADFLFFTGDYAQALSTYRQCAQDFRHDKAARHAAAALEMSGLCSVFVGASKRDVEAAFDQALNLYVKAGEPRYALRCQLTACRALASAGGFSSRSRPSKGDASQQQVAAEYVVDAARRLIAANSEIAALEQQAARPGSAYSAAESFGYAAQASSVGDIDIQMKANGLRRALLLEQTAQLYQHCGNSHSRKLCFYNVLAGHTFNKLGLKKFALRCYSRVIRFYLSVGWQHVDDHLHFTMARQSFALNILPDSVFHFVSVLNALADQRANAAASALTPSPGGDLEKKRSKESMSDDSEDTAYSAASASRETTYLKEFFYVYKIWTDQEGATDSARRASDATGTTRSTDTSDPSVDKSAEGAPLAVRIPLVRCHQGQSQTSTRQDLNVILEGDEPPQGEVPEMIPPTTEIDAGHAPFPAMATQLGVPVDTSDGFELAWQEARLRHAEGAAIATSGDDLHLWRRREQNLAAATHRGETSGLDGPGGAPPAWEGRETVFESFQRACAAGSAVTVVVEMINPLKMPLECYNVRLYGSLIRSTKSSAAGGQILSGQGTQRSGLEEISSASQNRSDSSDYRKGEMSRGVDFPAKNISMQPLQTLRCRLGCVPREDGLLRIEGLQLELFGLVKVSTPFRVYGRRLTPKELAKSELDGQKYPPGRRRSLSSIEFVSSDITPHATRDLSRSEIHARKRHRYFAESLKLHKLLAKDEEHQERARNHRADYRLNVHVSSRLPRVSYKFRNWPSGQKSALLDGEILTNVSLVVMNTGNVPIIDFRVGVSPSDFVFFPEIARRLELSCLAPASGKQNRPQLGVAVRNYKPLMPGAAITIPLVVRASDVGTFRIGFCLYAAAGSGPEAVEAIAAQPAAVPSPDNHDATSTIYTPQKMRAKTSGGAALSISHLERKWQAVERSLTVGPSLSLKTTSTISSHKLDFYSVITHLENRCRSAAINLVDLTVFPAEDEEQQAKVVGKDRGAAAPPEKSVWQLRTADCLPLTPVPAEHLTLASNKSLELLFSCRSPISQAAALSGKTAAHGDAPFHSRKHPLSAPPLSPGHHKGPSPIKSQALSTAAMIRELHNFFGPLTQLVDNFKLGTDLLRSLPHPTPRMTPPPTAPADDQDPSASLEAAADALAADETALIGVIYEFYCEMHHTVRKQRLRKSPVDGTNVDDSGMISADAVDIVARWQYTPPQPQTTAPLSPAGNPPSPPPAQAAIKGTSPQSGPLRGAIVRRGEILNCRVYLFKGPSYCPLKVQVSPPSRSIPLNWPRSCTVPIKVHVRNMTRTQRLSALVGVDQEASAFKMTPSGGEGGGREVSESPYSASLYSQATSSKQPIMQAFGGDAAVAASRKLFAASGFFWIGATLRRLPPLEPMQAAEVFLTAWFPAPGVYNVQKLKISVETSEFVLENPRADGDIQQDCDFHRILGMEPPAEEAADETRRYTNIVMNSYVYVFPSQREAIWAQPASLRRRSASRSGAGSSRGAGSAQRRRSKPPSPDAADDMPEQSSVCQQQQEETTATVGGVAKTPTPRGGKVALRSSGSASGKQMGIAPSAATVRKSYSPSGGVT